MDGGVSAEELGRIAHASLHGAVTEPHRGGEFRGDLPQWKIGGALPVTRPFAEPLRVLHHEVDGRGQQLCFLRLRGRDAAARRDELRHEGIEPATWQRWCRAVAHPDSWIRPRWRAASGSR